VIGTGVTGFFETLGGYGLAFYAAAAFAGAAGILIAVVRTPGREAGHRRLVTARSILAIFHRRDVLVPAFTNALCQFGVWALTFGFMPLLARQMGASAVATSLIMTLNVAANMAANLFTTFFANRRGKRALLYGSFTAFAAGAMLASLSQVVPLLFVSTVAMGLANGVFFPILVGLSIQRVDAAHRNTAMGIHQAVYALGMFTGPWIAGILADAVGIRVMFAIVGAFCLIAPGILISLNRRDRPSSP
jgi:MFS family permease